MATEIERKFLLKSDEWRDGAVGQPYRQGYLANTAHSTVRVRVAGEQAWLTIKGATHGIARAEFEYPIPVADALQLLDTLCERPLIEKTRYRVPQDDVVWEIDEFHGENAGLVVAEVELEHPEQALRLPHWIGAEVSGDPRYFNSSLVRQPFSHWSDQG